MTYLQILNQLLNKTKYYIEEYNKKKADKRYNRQIVYKKNIKICFTSIVVLIVISTIMLYKKYNDNKLSNEINIAMEYNCIDGKLVDYESSVIDKTLKLASSSDNKKDSYSERNTFIKNSDMIMNESDISSCNYEYIRCAVYCDGGYTSSGEHVRYGVLAGKKEWLYKYCNLYRVNKDGSIGELIGKYQFLDTGYGVNGSIVNGTSIVMWQPSLENCHDYIEEYGDYVYMEFIN